MTEVVAEPRRVEKGRSLWQDAFRRLRKNRLAMIGLVVTSIVALSAILAPWIAPYPPEQQESQYALVPPRRYHLTLESVVVFRVGQTTTYPAEAADRASTRLEMLIDPGRETRVLVGIRRGKILRLTRGGDMRSDPGFVLAVGSPEEGFYRLSDQNSAGEALSFRQISIGMDCPEELRDPGRDDRRGYNVEILLKEKEFPEPRWLRVDLERDRIVGLELAGASVDERQVRSWDVKDVLLDGHRYEHQHLLGTDGLGRDLFSRILYGGRISLLIGLAATIVSLLIGVVYGATAGYAGGKVDAFLMRVVDILYALPYMFLVILLLVFVGKNIVILFVALGAVQWLDMARIVRGQALSLKEKEFIEAARACGAGPVAIVLRHLIPNVLGVVVVYTTLTIPAVILQESFLSFVGFKVQHEGRDLESWGALTDYGRQAMATDGSFQNWWLLVFPAATLAVSLLCMNFLGDGLRDALDPRQKGRG